LFYYPDTPENKAFVEQFRKAYNRYPKVGALYGYVTAKFIVEGFKKAGTLDKEKFIDALEGLVIDSPVGKVELRKCDHQLILPMFFGRTKKVEGWNFLIATDIQTIPGKDYIPSCEEVLKLRR
jgi:branched-chain amino acid transport system substrate-binding protein